MLDFTSSLYLGFRHETRSLRPWSQLTTGAPAALIRPFGSEVVASQLARLQGCEAATLAPSTLHLFWDLFGLLAGRRAAIYLDAGAYPIARWGVERAAARGVPVRRFPHRDAGALRHLLRQGAGDYRPVVVADGMCTACGCAVPVADYLDSVRRAGGLLVIDDTQALGILGHSPAPEAPYGRGGGGSLRRSELSGPDVLVVSSLAKSFGVPMAVLAGSRAAIQRFEEVSDTRIHCSPPSLAVIHAAEHALAVNQMHGDALRLRLARLIQHFRKRLTAAGFSAIWGLFPVQTIAPMPNYSTRTLHQQLLDSGVKTVLHHGRHGRAVQISFIITARHRREDIEHAVSALAEAVSVKAVR